MAKFIYRRPPYPEYDMEGIESWLEDLAAQGLMLDYNGYVFGFMQFQRHEPKKLKYRLEAIPKKNPYGFKDPPDPEERAQAFYREFGWEYLGQFFDYYIYRSTDENAVELNTDPTLQAVSLDNVRRRNALVLWITIAAIAAACVILLRKGRVVTEIINEGWLSLTLFAAFMLTTVITWSIRHLHIIKLQKKLRKGESLNRDKNWRRGQWLRRLWIILPWLCLAGYHITNAISVTPVVDNALIAAEYQEPLPFATMAEMDFERSYDPQIEQQLSIWYDPLSPTNFFWAENAYMEDPDEVRWFGGIELYWHEAANEWLAEEIIREYLQVQEFYSAYTPVEIEARDYGFDFLAVYQNYYGAHIFIRNGDTVIKAIFTVHTWGENDNLYPLWLDLMAEKLA